jgi:ribosomal protein L23
MAKAKVANVKVFLAKPKRKRKGVNAKTKTSKSKKAKNYVKLSRGQG